MMVASGKDPGGSGLPGGFCAPWRPEITRKPESTPKVTIIALAGE